jgi:hypothetical protein
MRPTKKQEKDITSTVGLIIEMLQEHKVPLDVASSALMITKARIAVYAEDTDEFIVDQFRKTLAASRQLKEAYHDGLLYKDTTQ